MRAASRGNTFPSSVVSSSPSSPSSPCLGGAARTVSWFPAKKAGWWCPCQSPLHPLFSDALLGDQPLVRLSCCHLGHLRLDPLLSLPSSSHRDLGALLAFKFFQHREIGPFKVALM